MDIVGPNLATPTLVLANASATASWQVGQRLDAVVTARISPDRVTLQIGGALLEARTSLAAAAGQRLHLEIARADNQIILRVIGAPPKPDPLAAALRAALPQQLPLQSVFSRFGEALTPSTTLPPAAAVLLKQLLMQLPTRQTIVHADVLKQTLMGSGLFLENKLNRIPPPSSVDKDLKANLLRLLAELNKTQGDDGTGLARQVEAALARIQMHQLAALAEERTPALTWSGELPVRHGDQIDVFQFHIERDKENATTDEQQSWCTWLSFNLKSLGPLYVKITLTNKNMTATLWAELSTTVTLVNQHLDFLHQSLDQADLEVKGLQCLQGRPPFPRPDRLSKGLLDLTA